MSSQPVSVEDVPLNRFHRLLCLRAGGGWLVDGYVLSIVGVAMAPLSRALWLDSFWQGMVAASALFGIFIGGFVGGWLTGHLGRRKLFFVGPALFFLCSLLQYWADSGTQLFFLRLLIGIGVGFEYPVAGALLVEFLPSKQRGPRLAALTLVWFGGAVLAYLCGSIILDQGGADAWRLVLASPALIGALLLLLRIGTPESPRWLLSKGRAAEAEGIVRQVYGPAFSLKNLPEQSSGQDVSVRSLLHSGYGKRMLFVAVFWTCSVIPVFAVYAFAPKVLRALNLHGPWAAYGSIFITALFVVGCAIATRMVNVVGRRRMLIHSFAWSGLALLGLGLFADAAPLLVMCLFGAYAIFIGGAQVLQLVYPNELFPTEIRSVAVGIGASLSRVGAAIGTWLVPIGLQHIGIGNTMFAAAAVTLVGLLASLALAPETGSLSLQEASGLGGAN